MAWTWAGATEWSGSGREHSSPPGLEFTRARGEICNVIHQGASGLSFALDALIQGRCPLQPARRLTAFIDIIPTLVVPAVHVVITIHHAAIVSLWIQLGLPISWDQCGDLGGH